MHRLGVRSVVGIHQAGIELCLSGSGESLALDDVCTTMTYFDILVDRASEILGISAIILTAMTLVILVSCERDSIAAVGKFVVFYRFIFEIIGIFIAYLAVAGSCYIAVNVRFVIMLQTQSDLAFFTSSILISLPVAHSRILTREAWALQAEGQVDGRDDVVGVLVLEI